MLFLLFILNILYIRDKKFEKKKQVREEAEQSLLEFYEKRKIEIESNKEKNYSKVIDEETSEDIWERIKSLIEPNKSHDNNKRMREVILSLVGSNIQFSNKSTMDQYNFPKTSQIIQQKTVDITHKTNKSPDIPMDKINNKNILCEKRKTAKEKEKKTLNITKKKIFDDETVTNNIKGEIDKNKENDNKKETHTEDIVIAETNQINQNDMINTEHVIESPSNSLNQENNNIEDIFNEEDKNIQNEEINNQQSNDAFGDFFTETNTEIENNESTDIFFSDFANNNNTENDNFTWSMQDSNMSDFSDFDNLTSTSNSNDLFIKSSDSNSDSDSDSDSDELQSYGGYYSDDSDDEDEYAYGTKTNKNNEYSKISFVKQLFSQGDNQKTFEYLFSIIESDNTSMIKEIKNEGDNNIINKFNNILQTAYLKETNQTVLHIAVLANSISWLEYAVTIGCENKTDNDNNTALHLAAALGNLEMIEILIDKFNDIGIKNLNGRTPLHMASINGQLKSVVVLLTRGANVLDQDSNGLTCLHLACLRSSIHIVKHILIFSEDINNVCDYKGRTAIHAAAHVANAELIKLLLSKRVDINCRDCDGRTPLIWCLMQTSPPLSTDSLFLYCFKYLIEQGADITICDSKERNIIHYASYYGLIPILEYLREKNIICDYINNLDYKKQSCLFSAIVSNLDDTAIIKICELLLNAGCDSTIRDIKGLLPIHLALSRNKHSIATFLYKYIEDTDSVDNILLRYCAKYAANSLTHEILLKYPKYMEMKDEQGNTLLFPIVEGYSTKIFDYMLHVLDRNKVLELLQHTNNKKRNIIHIIAGLDRIDILQDIIKYVNDKTITNNLLFSYDSLGMYPIHYAALRGSYFTLEYLLNYDDSFINSLTKQKKTLLHAVVSGSGDIRCIEILIKSGLNVNAIDSSGRSAIFYALTEDSSCLNVIQLLISKYSASLDITDKTGQSFIVYVSQSQYCSEIMKIINEYD